MRILKKTVKIGRLRERGFSLIEIGLTLIAVAISTASISLLLSSNANTLKSKAIAEKVKLVTSAAHQYMTKNEVALYGVLSPGGAAIAIPAGKPCATCAVPSGPAGLPSIQGDGLLSSAFVDSNNSQQRHALIIKQLSAAAGGGLEGVVTTYGGSRLEDEEIGYVSGLLGAYGGGVYNNAAIAATNQISGTAGGWGDATSNWSASISGFGSVRPTSGTVQASLSMAGDSGLKPIDPDDVLYRKDVGYPIRNTMETNLTMGTASDIIMGGNDVTGATLMTSRVFRDTDNNYNVDPSTTTRLNVVDADGIVESRTLVEAPYFRDRDNNYNVDPSGTTRLTTLNTDGVIVSQAKITANGTSSDIEAGRDLISNRHISSVLDTNVGRNITAGGTITSNGTISANGATSDVIAGRNVTGNFIRSYGGMRADGDLNVYGNSYLRRNTFTYSGTTMWLGGALDVTGATALRGTNTIDGATTFNAVAHHNARTNFNNRVDLNGNVYIVGTVQGNTTFNGNVTANAYYYSSDERLKTDIEDLDGWAVISKLKPKAYKFKKDGRESMGLIAQEVEEEFPSLVQTDEKTGMKSVNYIDLIAPMIDEIQNLRSEVDDLKAAQAQ